MDQLDQSQTSFGVRDCAKQVLRIFLARWWFFVLVGLAASTIYTFGVDWLYTADATGTGSDALSPPASPGADRFFVESILFWVLLTILGSCEYGAYVKGAYDAQAGRRTDPADYLRVIWQNFAPLVWSIVAAGVLVLGGFVFLVVPGIWLACMYALVVPAVIIDRSRFGSLRRSRFLTKGYRWSILGLGLVVGAVILVVQLPIFLLGMTISSEGAASFLVSVLVGVTNPLVGIAAAVAHMRLTELKASQPTS